MFHTPFSRPLLLVALVLASAQGAYGQISAREKFASLVVPPAKEVELRELRAGVDLQVRNTTDKPFTARLQVVNDGRNLPISRLIDVSTGFSVPPGGTLLQITSAVQEGAVRPGRYSGIVQALNPAGRPIGKLAIEVKVLAQLAPAESVWTASVAKFAWRPMARTAHSQQAERRCAPLESDSKDWLEQVGLLPCVRDNVIPLRASDADREFLPAAFNALSRRKLLGIVHNADGHDDALVWWTGTALKRNAATPWPGVEMEFVGLDEPGLYKGRIQLPLEAGSRVVQLSVRVSHDWPLVLIPIMLGVLLSMWLRYYIRKGQVVLGLRERRTRLVVRLDGLTARLAAVDDEYPEAGRFRVDTSVADHLRASDQAIKMLSRSRAAAEVDDREATRIASELSALESLLDRWCELADALERSGAALQQFDTISRDAALGAARAQEVKARTDVAGLLVSAELADAPAVAARRRDLLHAADFLERWCGVGSRLVEVKETVSGDVLKRLADDLWAASTPGALELVEQKVRGQVPSGTVSAPKVSLLRRLRPRVAVPAVVGRSPRAEAEDDAARWNLLARWAAATPAERIALRLAAQRVGSEILAGIIAFLVAAVTALADLYTTNAYFGTLNDYVLAALWGFGTKVGLDMVRETAETGRLPLAGLFKARAAA
jgi:hypothetical protein